MALVMAGIIGTPEIFIILILVVLVFGAKRIPELMRRRNGNKENQTENRKN